MVSTSPNRTLTESPISPLTPASAQLAPCFFASVSRSSTSSSNRPCFSFKSCIEFITISGAGAAHCQFIHLQSGLAHADGHALALFPAGTHPGIEFQVVAHHAYPCQYIRTVADQCRPLDRMGDLAAFDQVGLVG